MKTILLAIALAVATMPMTFAQDPKPAKPATTTASNKAGKKGTVKHHRSRKGTAASTVTKK